MSTLALRAPAALRMRVNMSAIGSVIMSGSPAGLGEAGNLPLAGQVAQAETTHAEAAEEGSRTPAQRAAVVRPHLELRGPRRLHHETRLCHRRSLRPERHPERPQEGLALRVGAR